MMKPIHVIVSATWRLEELNVFLEILKLNFKKNYKIHVFCNVCESEIQKVKSNVDLDLVEELVMIPDERCTIDASRDCYDSYKNKVILKRHAPFDAMVRTFKHIVNNISNVESFIYTECDMFPLDEDAYILPLNKLEKANVRASFVDDVSSKTPAGYLLLSPIYLSYEAIANAYVMMKNNYIHILKSLNETSMEGEMAYIFRHGEICTLRTYWNKYTDPYIPINIHPITKTTHQHNPHNLVQSLKHLGMTNGKMITRLLQGPVYRAWNNELLSMPSYQAHASDL